MKIVYDAFANKSVFLGNYTLRAEMRNYLTMNEQIPKNIQTFL